MEMAMRYSYRMIFIPWMHADIIAAVAVGAIILVY